MNQAYNNRYAFVISEGGWDIIDSLVEELTELASVTYEYNDYEDYIEALYAILFSNSLSKLDVVLVIRRIIQLSNDLIILNGMKGLLKDIRPFYIISERKDGTYNVILNEEAMLDGLDNMLDKINRGGEYKYLLLDLDRTNNPVIARIYDYIGNLGDRKINNLAIAMAAALVNMIGKVNNDDLLDREDLADNRAKLRELGDIARDDDVLIIRRFIKDLNKRASTIRHSETKSRNRSLIDRPPTSSRNRSRSRSTSRS